MDIRKSSIIFFALFTISGATGLIYESIWSHYLKLFLGHAAYAQALVLTIFMGGMAFGAYLTARLSVKWTNLLLIYALVEILIGCFGVVFNPFFQTVLSISHENIIPSLGTPNLVHIYKWVIGALIILPQSILLGMTFPLMSNGIIRRFPNTPGKTLGILYFTNSIGGAVGVLFSGFYLVKSVGLPGTILTAGISNILLAIIVYGIAKGYTEEPYAIKKSSSNKPALSSIKFPNLILLAAFITGMASFIYEISWIRMLSMVLGSSTHAFELMLSAFITGLAFGGLWLSRKIENIENPTQAAGYIQIAMGIMAFLTLPMYNYLFDLMGFFMSGFERNDTGYELFTLSSYFISLIVMLPATFFAGMTLPLFTFIMLNQGHGEKSIGQIYASNTLGAITGIIFTVFIGMPLLGLKFAILFACGLDILLGLFLLFRANSLAKNSMVIFTTISGIAMFALVFAFDLDKYKMNASVFRTGTVRLTETNSKMLFHKDAKTTSVGVVKYKNGFISILTNGKPDASISTHPSKTPSADEVTMITIATLPLSINPDASVIANIGMGSGLTAHALLTWPNITQVDTIEIEPAIVEGANYFRPHVENTFTDPRSKIYIEDAKTYFSTYKKDYDIIISEPSNPWVSGVSSLFTDEFYKHISNHLSEKGIFEQWIQAYEIDIGLFLSILKALKNNFSNFSLYAGDSSNLIIVARNNYAITQSGAAIFNNAATKKLLARIGINNIQDIKVRFIADQRILNPFIDKYAPATNSDYFPYLDLNATRTRFKKNNIYGLTSIRTNMIPFINILYPDEDNRERTNVSDSIHSVINQETHQAQKLFHALNNMDEITPKQHFATKLKLMTSLASTCQSIDFPRIWIGNLRTLATLTIPYLSPSELSLIWEAVTPKCEGGLNDDELNWLGFVKALSQRNSESIIAYSSRLIEQEDYWDIKEQRLYFTAQLTALIKLGKNQHAKQLWDKYIPKLYKNSSLPLILLILDGLITQNLNEETAPNGKLNAS